MFEMLSWIMKYVLVVVIYIFIFRIVKLIYADIKMITVGESAIALMPHVKLLTPVAGKDGVAVADIYPLVRQHTVIGRAKKCEISLPDPFMSSKHVRIDRLKNSFFIEDLGSANGTCLNGMKLEDRAQLRDGDRISLGKIDLVFSEGGR